MRRLVLSLLLLIVLVYRGPDSVGGQARVSDKEAAGPLLVGERLEYDVSWSSFIVAGELALSVVERNRFEGRDAYRVVAEARSVGLVSATIYKLKDVYESLVDAERLVPMRADKRSRRGRKYENTSYRIDQDQNLAIAGDGRTIRIPPETYDLASILYAIRNIDLTTGKARLFSILEADKLYTIRVEPEAREKVYTRASSFDAVRVAIKMVDGQRIKDTYEIRLYITRDKRRLPVLVTASPSWGQIRVELTSSIPSPHG